MKVVRRPPCAVQLTLAALFFLVSPAASQEVRLGRWEGAIEGLVDFSRVETDTGDSDTVNETTRTEERLTLRNVGASIFDPRLMTMTIGGTFGLSQERSEAKVGGDSVNDTRDGTLWGYDTLASILPGQATSLNLFANRNQFTLSRELAGRTEIQTENRGATLFARRLYLPSTFTFRQEFDDEESRSGNAVTRRDERRNIVAYEGRRGWVDTEMVVRYDFVDKQDEINPDLDYRTHDGDLLFSRDFGAEANWRLDSRLHAYSRDGFSEETRVDLEEFLRADHTEQLQTRYRYFLEHTDRPEGNATRHTGSVALNHQLYESLNTDVELDARFERFPGGERDVFFARLANDYTKRLPRGGQLLAGFGGTFAYEDDRFDSDEVPVFDERHTFAVPFALPAALNNPFVIESSVEVTKIAHGPPVAGCGTFSVPRPLEEGVDYTLQTSGDVTEIVPIPCTLTTPGINGGDTIEVDYRYSVSPSLTFTTTSWRVSLSVDYGWIRPYYIHDQRDQHLISGRDGDFLDNERSDTVGVELRYGEGRIRTSLVGEAENLTGDDRAYTATRATQLLGYSLRPGLQLTLTGEQLFKDYSRPESRNTRILTGRAVLSYTFDAGLSAELYASTRDLHDTRVVDQRTTETGLRARWVFGKLEMIPNLRLIDVRRGDTKSDDYRITVRVIRRL